MYYLIVVEVRIQTQTQWTKIEVSAGPYSFWIPSFTSSFFCPSCLLLLEERPFPCIPQLLGAACISRHMATSFIFKATHGQLRFARITMLWLWPSASLFHIEKIPQLHHTNLGNPGYSPCCNKVIWLADQET